MNHYKQYEKFIVVEGSEGAGKSTAISAMKDVLKKHGSEATCTREPGGTPLAESMRTLIKSAVDEKVSPMTELMVMYAARVQLCENVIIPSLINDEWLISDRFFYSTFAYQGGGRELGFDAIQPLHDLCLKGLKPGLVIYMDIDPLIGLERARGRGELDRFELEQVDFFNRIRQAYLDMAEQNPEFVIIDASQNLEQVTQDVQKAVETYILSL